MKKTYTETRLKSTVRSDSDTDGTNNATCHITNLTHSIYIFLKK